MLNALHKYTHLNKKFNVIARVFFRQLKLKFLFKKKNTFFNLLIKLSFILSLVFNLFILPLSSQIFTWKIIIYLTTLLLTLPLFNYFRTVYKFSKWTTQIKFFWLRVFTIFWGLEFYLLFIFMFLFIISPDDFKYFFFITKVIFESVPNNITIFSYITILLLLLIVSSMVYSYVYKAKLNNYFNLVFFLTLILLILTLEVEPYLNYIIISGYKVNIQETLKVKLLNLTPNSTEYKIISNYCHLNSLNTDSVLKQRPATIILNIILIIKFYHVYIILLLTLVLILPNIWMKSTQSIELYAFFTQNLIILLIFYSFNYIIYYKFLYKYVLYGFYSNISVSSITATETSYILEFFQNELIFNFIL